LALSLVALLLSGCYLTPAGEKFNPRASHGNPPDNKRGAVALTNLVSVESTNRIRSEWLQPSTNAFRLGPGDKLDIEILPIAGSRAMAQVGPDGKLYYYELAKAGVPALDVWGMTLDEAKAALADQLKTAGGFLNPVVSMQLHAIDSTRVWVLGRVANPGIYPMPAPMTLLEAISHAGGTSSSSTSGTTEELADLRNSFIMRNGERLPVNFQRLLQQGDMSQNVYVEPDDFIFLPSAASRDIYILGAVRQPKAVPRQHNDLIGAIADAGGPIKDAYLSHVAVVRGSLDNPRIAVVDYKDIIKGKAPNILLEPRDIVYVPYSPYRFLTKYLDLIMLTFVRAVAINEGARAADPNAAPAGISIGVSGTPGVIVVPGGTGTTGGGTGTPGGTTGTGR
jgi:protein involved in polysaccharide export with SLBB domain